MKRAFLAGLLAAAMASSTGCCQMWHQFIYSPFGPGTMPDTTHCGHGECGCQPFGPAATCGIDSCGPGVWAVLRARAGRHAIRCDSCGPCEYLWPLRFSWQLPRSADVRPGSPSSHDMGVRARVRRDLLRRLPRRSAGPVRPVRPHGLLDGRRMFDGKLLDGQLLGGQLDGRLPDVRLDRGEDPASGHLGIRGVSSARPTKCRPRPRRPGTVPTKVMPTVPTMPAKPQPVSPEAARPLRGPTRR